MGSVARTVRVCSRTRVLGGSNDPAHHGPARRSPAWSAAARGEAQSAGVLTGSAICASGDPGRRLPRAARAPPALRVVPRPRPRRICYRSAGAWATAAPPPPRASPPPAPPRNRPRISSPESTSRRRCRWLRTQFSQALAIRSYTKFVMGIAVSMLTYPFLLVGDLMAVNNCGLRAGLPPYSPVFKSWIHCWKYLSVQGQLFRGSSLLFRRVSSGSCFALE